MSHSSIYYSLLEITPQAAGMAATAAASGQGGYLDVLDFRSPVKMEPLSPQMNNQVSQGRHTSEQVTNPAIPSSQPLGPLMNNHAPRPSVPYIHTSQQHPQSPELALGPFEEPQYVNAKQFHRILKRRVVRQRVDEALSLTSKGRKRYMHESRHNHAMRRPRGPTGRFLTADERVEMERTKEDGSDGGDKSQETLVKGMSSGTGGSGTK
jgi:nuclear transcription factor Y alpha